MKNITPKMAEKLGMAVGASFMVSRHLYLGDTAKKFLPPIKIRDIVIGTAKERGLESRCNAYVLSGVAKDNVYYRDPRRDTIWPEGVSYPQGIPDRFPDREEAYIFSPYEVWETYAVQLYKLEEAQLK